MLLNTLPLMDHVEHHIITLFNEGELAQEFKRKGIAVTNVGLRSLLEIAKYSLLVGVIKRENSQIIITYLLRADFVGRFVIQWFVKIPVLSFAVTTYNFSGYFLARLFERLSWPIARGYFANSQVVKDTYSMRYGVPEKKIQVLHNGVNVSQSLLTAEAKKVIIKKMKLDEDDSIYICCVANLKKNKGHKFLLEAFEIVYKEYKNITLLLAGKGEEEEELKNQIIDYESRSKIIFLGQIRNVSEVLAISQIFILPTFFEGMSIALLEAMGSGLICITSDITENKKVIDDGETGILFKTGDSGDLAEKIKYILRDMKKNIQLGHNARKKVIQNYSVQSSALNIQNQILHEIKKYSGN